MLGRCVRADRGGLHVGNLVHGLPHFGPVFRRGADSVRHQAQVGRGERPFRIAGIRDKAGEGAEPSADVEVELHPAERALILKLLAFPAEVEEAAERRAPHRIATYALELAQEFTAFYRDCKVVGAEPPEAEAFRLALCIGSQRTIARALDLLGVSAPETM